MDNSGAIFVGRKKEIAAFATALSQTAQKTQPVYLHADGGMGKTKLLEQFQLVCDRGQVPHTQIIDFYETANQQVDSVMKRLASELSEMVERLTGEDGAPPSFSLFWESMKQLEDARKYHQGSETIATLGRLAERQFYADYNELAKWFMSQGKPVALFFDTFEVVQEHRRVSFWLLRRLLPAVINTVLVLAGRRALPEDVGVATMPVGNFTDREIEEYLHARGIFPPNPTAQLERIYALTKGNPLLLALAADWGTQPQHPDLDELLGKQDKEFERELVSDILHLSGSAQEFQTVWYMAHVWHRFDANMLAWIYGNDEYHQEEAKRVFANVSRFSYVKKREYSSTYQLHDDMCELIRKHVLPVEDPVGDLRRDLSRRMIDYYKQEIIRLQINKQKRDADIMRAEQLYHYFYLDPAKGYSRFKRLFLVADTRNDAPLCDALISSAQRFRDVLDPKQQIWLDVYQGWRDKNLGEYGVAATKLEKAIWALNRLDDPGVDVVANSLGYIYRLLGEYDKARQIYEAALEANKRFQKPAAERLSTAAMILNNLGNIHRLQGRVDEAHRYSMVSLMLRRQLDDERGIANSCFYLGLILREFGDITGALRYLAEAEQRYENLDSHEGSANVMRWRAYIHGHLNEYKQAIGLAEKSAQTLGETDRLSTDLADTLDILGRLYRDKAVYDFEVAHRQTTHRPMPTTRHQTENEVSGSSFQPPTEQVLRDTRDELLGLAEDYIERGYRMAKDVGDKFKEAESILSFVRLYYVRQEYHKSLKKYREGIRICREPCNYYLLASYFELFAGTAYFALKEYKYAFRHFAKRAYYASFCRAMELGMTMDSIGSYLLRLGDPKLIAQYADFLIEEWQKRSNAKWQPQERLPHILNLCRDIKEYVTQ